MAVEINKAVEKVLEELEEESLLNTKKSRIPTNSEVLISRKHWVREQGLTRTRYL